MKYYPVKALAVAALLIGSTAFMSPSYAAAPEPSVIHVTGYAQQEVAPDTAYVTIGMETTGEDAQQARTQNNEVMSQVTAAIEIYGHRPGKPQDHGLLHVAELRQQEPQNRIVYRNE